MAIASITSWLLNPNPNYDHGRMLYEQYGSDRLILTIIKSGSGSYHLGKLREALTKLNQTDGLEPKPVIIPDIVIDGSGIVDPKTKTNLDNSPQEIRDIRNNKNKLFAQARKCHEMIRVTDSSEQRLELALTILDNMDVVNESWVAMDTWAKTGEILEISQKEIEKEVSTLTMAELISASKNLPPRITRTREAANSYADPVKKAKYQLKLQGLIERFSHVKKRLDGLV